MRTELPDNDLRRFSTDALHVVGFSNLAIAQPLYDLLARHPEFFIARGAPPLELATCIGLLTIGVPGALLGTEALAAIGGQRARRAVHLVIVTALLAAITLPLLTRFALLAGTARLAAALVVAVGAGLALQRLRRLREFASLLAIGALLSPAIFVTAAPMRAVFYPDSSAEPAPVDATHSVVFVVLDELALPMLLDEAGNIDAETYPGFGRLAADSTWYPNTFTTSDYTENAVPSMLVGRDANRELDPTPSDYPENLFTLLAGGWKLDVHEPVTMLCPTSLCPRGETAFFAEPVSLSRDLAIIYGRFVLPESLAGWLPSISESWAHFADGDQTWRERFATGGRIDRAALFDRFIEGIRGAEAPTLHFLHILLPHAPYEFLPSGRRYSNHGASIGMLGKDRWGDDEWAVTQNLQRQLLQLGFVDRQLGRLLDRLHQQQVYEDTLVVVTSDHGVSFEPGGWRRRINSQNALELGSVPLFIKTPGQKAGVVDSRLVQSSDILPTLAHWLSLEIPWRIDGHSLAGEPTPLRSSITIRASHTNGGNVRLGPRELAGDNPLARRIQALQRTGGSRSLTSIAAHRELIGQPVADFKVVPNPALELDARAIVGSGPLRRSADFSPVHVSGLLRGVETPPPNRIAIAVDGVVRAVTQTFDPAHASALVNWSALLDENDPRPQGSTIRAYWIREDEGGLELHHTADADVAPLSFGVTPIVGIEESGFYATELWDTKPVRWTSEHAVLELPPSNEPPPTAIELELAHTGRSGNRLEVVVDGQEVFADALGKGPWFRRIALPGLNARDGLRIELKSRTFVPSDLPPDARGNPSPDRDLGVAIARLELIR